MTAQSQMVEPVWSFEDDNGRPLNGGQLFTYAAGTLTDKATYADSAGAIPNTNPVILNARGEATVYGTGVYRMILKDADGVTIWDRDNVATVGQSGADAVLALLAVNSGTSQGPTYIGFDGGTLADFIRLKNARLVRTIADLKALDKTIYNCALVLGYYSVGDGGGGLYLYDSTDTASSDNSGTLIVATDGGRWKWKFIGTYPTVNTFGARGNGTTDDKAAFTAMNTAESGVLRLLNKEYLVDGLSLTGDRVTIHGYMRPQTNNGSTALELGSILIGNVNIRANSVTVHDFGVDHGSGRGLGASDGFVINAKTGERGIKCVANDLTILGPTDAGTTHALLVQGYDRNEVRNIDVGYHQFGVVVKGRYGFIKNVRGNRIRTAVVYPKSDVAASAGDVLDGSVNNIIVDGVISTANTGNTECNAVYVHGSTLAISAVTVSNVRATFGNAAVRVAGGGTASLNANGVQMSNIYTDRAVCAVDLFGFTFDVEGRNITAVNPSSGRVLQTSGDSSNWNFDGMEVVVSDAAITSTEAALFQGTGAWDNLTVRNPTAPGGFMSITFNMSNVAGGTCRGDVKPQLEGNLTLLNSWTAGTRVPRMSINPRNWVSFTGWVQAASATSDTFATLPFSLSDEHFFACAARKTDSSYTTVVVYVSGSTMILQTGRSGITYVDLSNIGFFRNA